jgi:hypothetical protein
MMSRLPNFRQLSFSIEHVLSLTDFDSRGELPLSWIAPVELIGAQGYSSASTDRAQVGMTTQSMHVEVEGQDYIEKAKVYSSRESQLERVVVIAVNFIAFLSGSKHKCTRHHHGVSQNR